MLVDRLRMTDPKEVGSVWSNVMRHVYDLGGLYTLNLHPERGLLCQQALAILLSYARSQPLPVWLVRLQDVAQWWKERSRFRLRISPLAPQSWLVEADCTPRATLLARHLIADYGDTTPWSGTDVHIYAHRFIAHCTQCPCIGLSPQTPQEVVDFLYEQGYPVVYCSTEETEMYALYLDIPEGLGRTRQEQVQRRSGLVQQVEQVEAPLLRFGCWPDGQQAALAISGDIDSVTIQDFFLRLLEVRQ
jgi:hypothetical protein